MYEAEFGNDRPTAERGVPRFFTETYREIARLCTYQGLAEVNSGCASPEQALEPLTFRFNLDPVTVKTALFAGDSLVRLDPNSCYLSYSSPYQLDGSDSLPRSTVMLNVGGTVCDDLDFEQYFSIDHIPQSEYMYYGNVVVDYSHHGKPIHREVFMAGEPELQLVDDLIAVESGRRPLHLADFTNITKLLGSLETS